MSTDPSDGSEEAEASSHLSAGFLVGGGRYTLRRAGPLESVAVNTSYRMGGMGGMGGMGV